MRPVSYDPLHENSLLIVYSKTCVKQRQNIGFQDQLSLNSGQMYCRILSTFISLLFVIENVDLSIFEWPFYTGFVVQIKKDMRPVSYDPVHENSLLIVCMYVN